jgi:hypothetical protein
MLYPKYGERKSQKYWYYLPKCLGSYISSRIFVENSRNIIGDFKIKYIPVVDEG